MDVCKRGFLACLLVGIVRELKFPSMHVQPHLVPERVSRIHTSRDHVKPHRNNPLFTQTRWELYKFQSAGFCTEGQDCIPYVCIYRVPWQKLYSQPRIPYLNSFIPSGKAHPPAACFAAVLSRKKRQLTWKLNSPRSQNTPATDSLSLLYVYIFIVNIIYRQGYLYI